MAIGIINNYGNTAVNYADTAKNTGANPPAKGTNSALSGGKDKAQEYYKKLCKRFPYISINTTGDIANSTRQKIVLNLSNDCLNKMANNPDFAEKIEKDIAGIPQVHEQMFAKAKSDGVEIHGFAVRINADGSMQCSCSGSTRKSQNANQMNVKNRTKKKSDKIKEQNLERRKKETQDIENMQKEKEQRDAYLNKLQEKTELMANMYDAVGNSTSNSNQYNFADNSSMLNKQV